MTKKYIIYYGGGVAILHTPYPPEERFYTLANSCYGIKTRISKFEILKVEDVEEYIYFETLDFDGRLLAWNEEGARKTIKPQCPNSKHWDNYYCSTCKYDGGENATCR